MGNTTSEKVCSDALNLSEAEHVELAYNLVGGQSRRTAGCRRGKGLGRGVESFGLHAVAQTPPQWLGATEGVSRPWTSPRQRTRGQILDDSGCRA